MTYHFIGIGGIGMSSIAKLALEKKAHVTGSDLSKNTLTTCLEAKGAKIVYQQGEENIQNPKCVIYSSSISKKHQEYLSAKRKGIPLLHRSEFLQQLGKGYETIAVAGTHGKTTTTALLIETFNKPTYALGGILKSSQTNASLGQGDHFIFEADESDGTLVRYTPKSAIITHFNLDHCDHYQTKANLLQTYKRFSEQVDNHLFYYGDDESIILEKGISYGLLEKHPLRAVQLRQNGQGWEFDIIYQGRTYPDFFLNSPLKHNVINALGVFGIAQSYAVPLEKIRAAFSSFSGVHRRMDVCWDQNEITIVDDYAHHPHEIASTLESTRLAWKEKKLIALFQPHRFSRMQATSHLLPDLFHQADELIVTDIYGVQETNSFGLTPSTLLDTINHPNASYIPKNQLVDVLNQKLRPFDLLLSLGAGDISSMVRQLHPKNLLKVALLYGGDSLEHEISKITAHTIKQGLKEGPFELFDYYVEQGKQLNVESLKKQDFVFPAFHGPFGEDGTIQGLLEFLRIPYAGSGHTACALAMDKGHAKELFSFHGILTSPFYVVKSPVNTVPLTYPLFVKGVHLGSSYGVFKVENEAQLPSALHEAFKLDTKVVIEEAIVGRELEFFVIGNEDIIVFPPGEILTDGALYSYASKYGENAIPTTDTCVLDHPTLEKGKRLAKKCYEVLGCEGFSRVDFFLDKKGDFWVNEVNPIPGFTPTSLAPRLAEKGGYPLPKLLRKIVVLGLMKHYHKQKRWR